jgi:hypothetical protein
MTRNTRTGLWIAAALLVGVAAGAVGMLSLRGGDGPYASTPAGSRSMGAASASTAFVDAVAGNCDLAPVLPAAGDGDGREILQGKPQGATPDEVASRILSGKEAAAAGRQRDAEVDFLDACRNAATMRDGDPIPLADAMYQLGRHYANVAALGGAAGKQKELFQRAERLYSASLEAYRARYGDDHEKTRFAREGLITVQQATGGKPPTAIAKASPAAAAASVAAAAASAPVPVAAASAAAPAASATELAKAAPPAAAASQARKRAPRVPDEVRDRDDSESSPPARVEHLPAPVPVRERVAPRRDDADSTVTTVDEPRPRPQVRRVPVQENAGDDSAPAEVASPPPDNTGSGSGAASTAEGSPGTQ